MENFTLSGLTDEQVISGFRDLSIDAQENLVSRLEYIAELDRRKLSLHHSSLKAFLVGEHGLEEWEAERLIRLAKVLNRFPGLSRKLALGKLNPTLIELGLGAAHREKLSDLELWELFEAISGMSCKKARREIALRYPHTSELPRDQVRPLTEDLSELKCVVENSVLDKLEEIRGFLAHAHPKLSMGELIGVLATEYRERHHPEAKAKRAQERQTKRAEKLWQEPGKENVVESPAATRAAVNKNAVGKLATKGAPANERATKKPAAPRVASPEDRRHPSQALTHQMVLKMGYRCTYVDPMTGKRCQSAYRLDKDHIEAWADGGQTELGNLRWLCKSHHRRVSFLRFGESAKYFRPKRE